MTDRLAEISNNFSENRDTHYRERLRSLQTDIAYINNALLYDNKPLEDVGYDQVEDLNTSAGLSTQGSIRNGGMVLPTPLGRHAANFIHEVNDALEEKDARMVGVTVSLPCTERPSIAKCA